MTSLIASKATMRPDCAGYAEQVGRLYEVTFQYIGWKTSDSCFIAQVTVHVKSLFHAQFCIKDMGPASEFLNIRITQRPGVISIDQEPYVNSQLSTNIYWCYLGFRELSLLSES